MPEGKPLTILCVSSYEKGQAFIRTCKEIGCRVLWLTVEKLGDADWPRDSIDDIFTMPEELPVAGLINSVSYIARSQNIDRIVALDEVDMGKVSALREHLRIPGMGLTTVRYFRDKLSMRSRAKEAGIRVPEFVPVLNYDDLREYMARVPAPWLLKPRSQASGIGMRKIHSADELWPWLDELGDQQSFYLLEHFVPGTVYHVDSIACERDVVFAEAHEYGTPPLTTSHQGGVFTTSTLPPDAPEYTELLSLNRKDLGELGFVRGVTHAEFLKADYDGKFYFIEVAARLGGAISRDVLEAATGINLWREGARLEVGAGKEPYQLPPHKREYAAVILSLARQEHPDTSGYRDTEIVQHISNYHQAGLILKAAKSARLQELIASYAGRFQQDFLATQPVPDKPSF